MSKRKLNKEFQIRDIWFNQKQSSKSRGLAPPNYGVQELKDWCLSQALYHQLHAAWVASGFVRMLAPSVDRLDDYKPYSLDNIQLMTAGQNLRKGFDDCASGKNTKRSKGVIQFDLAGNYVTEYPSLNLAGRAMGRINGSDISEVCRGLRQTAHGHLWAYKQAVIQLADKEMVE